MVITKAEPIWSQACDPKFLEDLTDTLIAQVGDRFVSIFYRLDHDEVALLITAREFRNSTFLHGYNGNVEYLRGDPNNFLDSHPEVLRSFESLGEPQRRVAYGLAGYMGQLRGSPSIIPNFN